MSIFTRPLRATGMESGGWVPCVCSGGRTVRSRTWVTGKGWVESKGRCPMCRGKGGRLANSQVRRIRRDTDMPRALPREFRRGRH